MSLWIYKKIYKKLSNRFKVYNMKTTSLILSMLLAAILFGGIFTLLRYYLMIFNSTLEGGILASITYICVYSILVGDMTVLFGYWFDYRKPEKSKEYICYLLRNTFASLVVCAFALWGLNTVQHHDVTNKPMQEGVIYITHSPKCKYCRISDKNRKITSFIYQLSHTLEKDIVVVNVDEDNELTRDIKSHLEGRGSVIAKQNDQIVQKIYTLGKNDENRTPVEASVKHIYQITNDVQQLMSEKKKEQG
ncbi:MAG: hypothetical protein D8H99_56805 [Streptococcus sp.]|nr:MAG: hypothetical protein D8H99_56805 [Streptococcus sp.]